MVLVEGSLWPLVVIGALPQSPRNGAVVMTVDEQRLWSGSDLRIGVVLAAEGPDSSVMHQEVLDWLVRHKDRLCRCALRVAWIVEDDAMRQCVRCWLTLAGERLSRGGAVTFGSTRAAVSWLCEEGLPASPERVAV